MERGRLPVFSQAPPLSSLHEGMADKSMKSRRTKIALILALLAIAVSAITGLAQSNQPSDDEVNAVAKELYCPVCENIPLDVCPTQACAQWRDLIRQKLSEGWNKEQIKQYFAAQYGDRVLAEPPREGLNWLVYILPPIFFLGGVYLVYRVLRNRKPLPEAKTVDAASPAPDDPYLKRLEEELKRRK
jgi:cytochrome c-type biogenesis protein CcmH